MFDAKNMRLTRSNATGASFSKKMKGSVLTTEPFGLTILANFFRF